LSAEIALGARLLTLLATVIRESRNNGEKPFNVGKNYKYTKKY
jgi:hypothetical protein